MNNLQRMIVIPPELYNKLKDNFNNDKELSHLDKSMKEILNKKLSDNEKWYIYRQKLIKFANKRRQQLQERSYSNHHHQLKQQKPSNSNRQIGRTILSNMSTQTNPESQAVRKSRKIQTDIAKTDDVGTQYYNPQDEIYTFENPLQQSKPTTISNIDSETDDEVFDNDDEIRNLAFSASPAGKRIKERKSLSSSDVRMFETDDGDVITIPIFERPKKDTSVNRLLRSSTKKADAQTLLQFPVRKKTSKIESGKSNPKPPAALDISKWKAYR